MKTILYSIVLLLSLGFSAAAEECSAPAHIKAMADSVNKLSAADSFVITEQLASSLSTEEQHAFFALLSSENKIAFWQGRTQRLARTYDFSPEQLAFIDQLMQLEIGFRRGEIDQAEVQMHAVYLEVETAALFQPELAKQLSSIVSLKESSAPTHVKAIADSVNKLSAADSLVITEQLASSLPADDRLTFFLLLNAENQILFRQGRIQRLARTYDFSPEQLAFIKKFMQLETGFRRGEIEQDEVQTHAVYLELEMEALFQPELAQQLFFVSSFTESSLEETPQASNDKFKSMDELSLPPCNCNTRSKQKCSVCQLAAGNTCSWRHNGCGAFNWFNCNGYCLV